MLALWSLASNFFCLKTYVIQIMRLVMRSSLFPAEHNKVVVLMVYAKCGQGISFCPPYVASKTGHCNNIQSRDIFLEQKNSQNMDSLGLQCHTTSQWILGNWKSQHSIKTQEGLSSYPNMQIPHKKEKHTWSCQTEHGEGKLQNCQQTHKGVHVHMDHLSRYSLSPLCQVSGRQVAVNSIVDTGPPKPVTL